MSQHENAYREAAVRRWSDPAYRARQTAAFRVRKSKSHLPPMTREQRNKYASLRRYYGYGRDEALKALGL